MKKIFDLDKDQSFSLKKIDNNNNNLRSQFLLYKIFFKNKLYQY